MDVPYRLAPLAVWGLRRKEVESLEKAVDNIERMFNLKTGSGKEFYDSLFDPSVPVDLQLPLGEKPVPESLILNLIGGAPTGPEDEETTNVPVPPIELSLDEPLQLLVHGCPGSGKSYDLQQRSLAADHVLRTTLHPATSYADFVGTLRPATAFRNSADAFAMEGGQTLPGEPYVYYKFSPGPLLEAYQLACKHPSESVVLIIEELSRANAALVFGDMLQLLDRLQQPQAGCPEGYSAYQIRPEPAIQSWLLEEVPCHPFVEPGWLRFPRNLFLWSTMNRADQNARQLDSAFLRRWRKEYRSYSLPCEYNQPVSYAGGVVDWDQLRGHINDRLIDLGVPEDKLIGPYFLGPVDLSRPSAIRDDLMGYLWSDVLKQSRAPSFFEAHPKTLQQLRVLWDQGVAVIGEVVAPASDVT